MKLLKHEILYEYKLQADSGDRWGSAMSAFFDVAGELWWRGADIPTYWQYSHGCAIDPREHDGYMFEILVDAETSDLLDIGNILERYTRNLDRIGESY